MLMFDTEAFVGIGICLAGIVVIGPVIVWVITNPMKEGV
jgi:hypothetical protein